MLRCHQYVVKLQNFFPDRLESSSRMIDMYVEEHTVQNIVAAAHFAGLFNQTVVSQFLRTHCEVLCVGTVLPELKEALPNRTLKVQVNEELAKC